MASLLFGEAFREESTSRDHALVTFAKLRQALSTVKDVQRLPVGEDFEVDLDNDIGGGGHGRGGKRGGGRGGSGGRGRGGRGGGGGVGDGESGRQLQALPGNDEVCLFYNPISIFSMCVCVSVRVCARARMCMCTALNCTVSCVAL